MPVGRRPIRIDMADRLPFGTALASLVIRTTISGTPLSRVLFNNQGLIKSEFRAGLALVFAWLESERDLPIPLNYQARPLFYSLTA